jgi:UDP-N-acetylmuramoyl-tripeptide--D-alanyl-D-alanine ligase
VLRRAAGGVRVLTSGEGGDARTVAVSADAEGSTVSAEIAGRSVEFRLGAPGAHIVRNAVCALAAVAALGADPAAVAPRLRDVRAMQGRGAQ